MAVKNEIGNKYGRLTVLERAGNNKNGNAQWFCECECGNTGIFLGTRLRNGHTKSCGCLSREKSGERNFVEEVGNKYTKLTVISRVENTPQGNAQWLCKCDCGSLHIASGLNLRSGQVKSCGCIKSFGEEAVAIFLTELNIKFQKEYTFDDLRGIGGGLLRFDFAIFKDEELTHLIEFDGIQHFDENNNFYRESTVKHDQMKNDYCTKNNIRLIRITDYENLTIEVLGL